MDMGLSELWELVMDREAWRAAVHGVAKSRTRLSDWTELPIPASISLLRPGIGFFPPFQCWDYVLSFLLEQKLDPLGQQTCSAHPARFSPDDKYSRHRITIKKRFKVLMTQQPRSVLWGCLNISCVFCCLPAPKRLSAARLFSLWAWKFAPTLAPRIRSHLCLWLCLLWSSHGSIPVQGETFESFRTLNHCQVIKMISKSCYFVCCGKKGVV